VRLDDAATIYVVVGGAIHVAVAGGAAIEAQGLANLAFANELSLVTTYYRRLLRNLNVCLIDDVARGVRGVEVFDEALKLAGLLRLGHIHRVVGADNLFLRSIDFSRRAGLRLWLLEDGEAGLSAGAGEARQSAPTCRRQVGDVVVEVLMHNRGICALRQLPTFLDSALPEDIAAQRKFARCCRRLLLLLLLGHDELLERGFSEFLLDFLLEVDKLCLNLRVDVPFPLQRPAYQRDDVTV
jgi:hypothetical protein